MAKQARVAQKTIVFTEELLKEFRTLYVEIFNNKPTVEETLDVVTHPLYKRYCQLAPLFYSLMLKKRKEVGLR